MLNRDKPLGQRIGDGYIFGIPNVGHLRAAQYRAGPYSPPEVKRGCHGWLDQVGMPHGRSGDKAARKATVGTVGLTKPRGMYAAWHLKPAPKKTRASRV